jgi:hypothetical protein
MIEAGGYFLFFSLGLEVYAVGSPSICWRVRSQRSGKRTAKVTPEESIALLSECPAFSASHLEMDRVSLTNVHNFIKTLHENIYVHAIVLNLWKI